MCHACATENTRTIKLKPCNRIYQNESNKTQDANKYIIEHIAMHYKFFIKR